MMTSSKFAVVWCYTDGKNSVRRTLHSLSVEPCIEAARLINGNPYAFDIEVLETDSGKSIDWKTGIGIVLVSIVPVNDTHATAPTSDGFTDQRDEDEADQEYCDRAAGRA